MATLNATKMLLLTNQPKLTLTVTLTLTNTVTVIFFTRISLTLIKRLYRINARNFSWRHVAGFVGAPIFYPFADVAVRRSENTSDKKSIVYTLSLKEGFLWGKYKIKGLDLLGHNKKYTHGQQHITRAYRPCMSTVYIIFVTT